MQNAADVNESRFSFSFSFIYGNLKRLCTFGIIGGFGVIVNTLVFVALTSFNFNYLVAGMIATESAIISNFIGNHIFTFSDRPEGSKLSKRFLFYQSISLVTIAMTLLLLFLLAAFFERKNSFANLLLTMAIVSPVSFMLHNFYTWGNPIKFNYRNGTRKFYKAIRNAVGIFLALVLITPVWSSAASAADIVAVSQLGYHPNSAKQVVVYTDDASGTFDIKNAATDAVVASYSLGKSKDYHGNTVNCQGNLPCITGDFSGFGQEGNFYVEKSGSKSSNFVISKNLFADAMPKFLEFYNAMLLQGSSYHADMHSNYVPKFTSISDGSFIMEAYQAASALIRLGSAYRRNPSLFTTVDNYNILASGKPDMQEYILSYSNYLRGLQGLAVEESSLDTAFRLGTGIKIDTAFVPGPTNMTSLDVYIPGQPPQLLESVPVISLCGADNGTADWDKCIQDAAFYYKCQIDEPCLQISYIDKKGVVASNNNGYGVSKGWGYEFGCFFDIDLNSPLFDSKPNPCLVFHKESNREYTAMALLAFLEAFPAVKDYSASEGEDLLARAINTYDYIKNSYAPFDSIDADAGFWGTSLFLLYDYTGNAQYLQDAHAMRSFVSTIFPADATRGNEFYWEEYIRHKDAINNAGLQYQYSSVNPEEFFRGQIFHDYKDEGAKSIGNNAERVFEKYRDTNFQNSRQMLTMGLIASKTSELHPSAESFIPLVADNQLAWLTGMNAVQDGVALDSPLKSRSFIFGIGSFPSQFHSRYLIDTGYKAASNGAIIGARGTNYQFLDSGTNSYEYLDGKFSILGYTLGSVGNEWHNEANVKPFVVGKNFKNGKSYIPGWINGAFDTAAENDIIFNYNNNINTYEYTETTNEIVATAIELLAYLDGRLNNKPAYDGSLLNLTPGNSTNSGNGTGLQNQTNITQNGNIFVYTNPVSAEIYLNGAFQGSTGLNGILQILDVVSGNYSINISKTGYVGYFSNVHVQEGKNVSLNITLMPGTGQENSTAGSSITGSGTNLKNAHGTSDGTKYMREDANATFYVSSNNSNTIRWHVDGVLKQANTSKNSTFIWKPGILWVPKAPDYSNTGLTIIRAESPTENITWKVNVENVINPFFSSPDGSADAVGSSDTQIQVLTNNLLVNFTHINVTIQSTEGSNSVYMVHELVKNFEGNETVWYKTLLNMPFGNSYMIKITGFNNATKNTVSYELGNERAHYRSLPASSATSDDEESNEESGSSGEAASFNPKFVYAIFGKDVVKVNETQTITLDANNFNGGIDYIEATLISPAGDAYAVHLDLTGGNRDYGTWSGQFNASVTGLHVLHSVRMGKNNAGSVEAIASGQSFYVVDDSVSSNENLMLVYAILSHSTVSNGTNVTFKIDARDANGILSASAVVRTTRNREFTIPLALVNGNENYGTWEGHFKVSETDTVYSIYSITLANSNESKTYKIEDRSVYVLAIPGNQISESAVSKVPPFSLESMLNLLKVPLTPTLIGFSLMFFLIGVMLMTSKAESGTKKQTIFGK